MINWEDAYNRVVSKKIVQPNGCWYYSDKARIASAQPGKGYPVARVWVDGEWRMRKVARIVAEVLVRPKNGPEVCHSCNDPECWNPKHLRWDTHENNMRDKIADGTSLAGKNPNLVKLTEDQVREIRARVAQGESSSHVAKDYPVNRRQISRIASGARWSSL